MQKLKCLVSLDIRKQREKRNKAENRQFDETILKVSSNHSLFLPRL